jgi:hypothetical protein
MESRMEHLSAAAPDLSVEMSRLRLDMEAGCAPDPGRLTKVAQDLEGAVDQWEDAVARLRLSSDFQTREYAKLTQGHLSNHNMTVEAVSSMVRWQARCMRAMAENAPPPLPPASVDLARLLESDREDGGPSKAPPEVSSMAAAKQITATPFDGKEAAFESPVVKDEYARLCRDHVSLIELGGKFGEFDPLGKIRFLDEIKAVQERWDVFFARFSLMGALNRDYVRQCSAFLASMGMTEPEYRQLLEQCHDMMREEANAERSLLGL